jgi:iron complex transport system substrate-binding protein
VTAGLQRAERAKLRAVPPPRKVAPRLARPTGSPLAGVLACLLACLIGLAAPAAAAPAPAQRVVSLNPSLTATLLALDARAALVGVDDRSAQELPEVAGLPKVGGLFNPSLEAIVALAPDLVVWVPTAAQRDLHDQLAGLAIPVLVLENITLAELLASIEELGERVGRSPQARRRVAEIRAAFSEVERAAAGRPPARAVLVIQRDPLYVVGRGSFLDSMLASAGTDNLAGDFGEAYPRVELEWLIAAAPELILDAAPDPGRAADHWSRWPSIPAVASRRVVMVPAAVTLPGPHLDRAVRWLAGAVRGEPGAAEPVQTAPAPPTAP